MDNAGVLDQRLGLHEEITIIYAVDGYEATLYDQDGSRVVDRRWGLTVTDALEALANALSR